MTLSGPLGGSSVLPIAVTLLIAGNVLLALFVLVGGRPAIALAAVTAVGGVVVAAVGISVGLPMPWPLMLVGYNAGLAVVGVEAWRESRTTAGG